MQDSFRNIFGGICVVWRVYSSAHALTIMKKKRNRTGPATTLGERLQRFADEVQAKAVLCAPGRDRDKLEEKARKAKTIAATAGRSKE
jgi:hypothetical protein